MQMKSDITDGQSRDLGNLAVTQSSLQPEPQDFLLTRRKFLDQLVEMYLFLGVTDGLL